MTIDHIRTAIAEGAPSLKPVEVHALAKKLEDLGLVMAPGYTGQIDAGDWELSTVRLDIDRQMFKDGKVRLGGQVLVIPQPPKE